MLCMSVIEPGSHESKYKVTPGTLSAAPLITVFKWSATITISLLTNFVVSWVWWPRIEIPPLLSMSLATLCYLSLVGRVQSASGSAEMEFFFQGNGGEQLTYISFAHVVSAPSCLAPPSLKNSTWRYSEGQRISVGSASSEFMLTDSHPSSAGDRSLY